MQSGYTFRTRAILEQQRALGWTTDHITSTKHQSDFHQLEEDIDGLHFFRTPKTKVFYSDWPMFNQWQVVRDLEKRLDSIIARVQPDMLHAHSPALNGLAALRVARRHGLPLVYEVRAFWEDAAVDHGTSREGDLRYKLTRQLETYVMRNADAVTTICNGLREEIISRGLSESKVSVVPNSVDLARFPMQTNRDAALNKELALEDKLVIGFIGSFYAYEGLPMLLEALPKIQQQFPQVQLLLVGGGPQADALNQKVATMQLGPAVHCVGRVAHAQVQRYYSLVDVFIYPRISMRLTDLVTPLKPLEAMAQGGLVVASDVGGHQELIEDGVTGSLFRAGDVQSLSDTVCGLLTKPDSWGQRRSAARKFVEDQRNWRTSVERYAPIYNRLTS